MSDAAFSDDEISLLDEIWERLPSGDYWYAVNLFEPLYALASFILQNVTAHRLDASETTTIFPNVSEERVAYSTERRPLDDHAKDAFELIGTIFKEIERARSAGMDEHTFGLSLPAILGTHIFRMDLTLFAPLAAFAVTHGVWLLALKFICAETGKEDLMILLKRVSEGIFNTLGAKNFGDQETNYGLYLYVSLLSSIIVIKPEDNWKSLSPLYNLILVMSKVVPMTLFFVKNVSNLMSSSLWREFIHLYRLSFYWITRGVLASSHLCNTLPKNRYVIQNSQNLMDICDKLNSIHEKFQCLVRKGVLYMDDERFGDPYQILEERRDNYYSLMALFGPPLESKKLKLSKDIDLWTHPLKNETLLLIISRLDISSDEILFLKDTYVELKTSVEQKCEFIWVPIHDGAWTTFLEERYTKVSQMMPWYTVEHPTFITEDTKKFVRDVWKFYRKPIIVVLDQWGRVQCPNAIHLMYTWGAKAFPFTRLRERALWTTETMRLDSLVLSFDPDLSSMLEAQKWIILYGGGDAEWIQEFIARVHEVTTVKSDISTELIYVGNNTESEQIRRIKDVISTISPRSHSLSLRKIRYFWTRLESLLISLSQTFSASGHTMDPFIQEVKKLLSYATAESWACLITPSSDLMIHGFGDTMLQAFTEYEAWKHHLHTHDFTKFFKTYIEQLERRGGSGHSCSRIILNIDNKDAVVWLTCPQCTHVLEKKVQYRCCHVDNELE
uniref:Sieve element occlusion C-terminal domain-containing protein n=1 Tax=Kalanchoe fedtschenkoi TaxID=63787 RepID=A0A7N0SVT8_KALFE